ncbi:MAG TPA: ATP-grasp domain-containing protein [Candidatus Pacearchaeota archaeon]|nr:ATP-grasp domain-containing protein [Candidatus Pacearchaeota archaeon]
MPNKTIGILYGEQKELGREEKIFVRLAKRKKIDLVLINTSKETDDKKIEDKIKKCDIVYNNIGEGAGIEIAKTVEALGKTIIEPPETYYFIEDKWMFFLKCKENGVPTPETILLSDNIILAKSELKKFKRWPVILKRIHGTWGEFVEKANNLEEAEKIIKKFWKKSLERHPIIAQEFIRSPSYRITVIDNKIVQTAIKENIGWKATGLHKGKFKRFKKFEVNSKLERIIKKVVKFSGIGICGIDLLKKGDSWFVLEINAAPGFDFFLNERKKLLECVLDYLIKYKN